MRIPIAQPPLCGEPTDARPCYSDNGKPAIGLYLPAAGHDDLLLDPNTYQVIGRLSISTGHFSQAEQATAKAKGLKLPPAGTVTWSVVRSTTLVNGPGQN